MTQNREFDLTGVGHALTDVVLQVSEEQLKMCNLVKSSSSLASLVDQQELINNLGLIGLNPTYSGGGSVANTVYTFVKVGGKGAFIGSVGKDLFGNNFSSDLQKNGVSFSIPPVIGEITGTSLVLVTPDGERTMSTCLGVGGKLSISQVDISQLQSTEWLLVEGYLLANSDIGPSFVNEIVKRAKECGTKVAFTCSDPWVVLSQREQLLKLLPSLDLIVANEYEAFALLEGCEPDLTLSVSARRDQAIKVVNELATRVREVVVTSGDQGCFIKANDLQDCLSVATEPVTPVDLTGAGDAFLGGYLRKRLDQATYLDAGLYGNTLAKKIITKIGARLDSVDL
jgi:sugar/nucleoside kinase (ribokinase family)